MSRWSNTRTMHPLLQLPAVDRTRFIRSLSDRDASELLYDWRLWARKKQISPKQTDWVVWMVVAGRGWGKTRTGAEWVRQRVNNGYRFVALVGQTAADVRDVMVEGESGLLAISPPWDMPKYEPSKRRITWQNGATATTFSGDEPDQLRGPQHDTIWADELAKWRYCEDTWDNLELGLRLGAKPRILVTTTPRPLPLVKQLMQDKRSVVVSGSSYENKDNLAPQFIERISERYEGTRIGRQEIYAEILDDTPGALWNHAMIEDCRVADVPSLDRVVVAIDPAVTNTDESDETGIVVAGQSGSNYYVLADLSIKDSPEGWARRAVAAYEKHKADRIIGEVNNGGDLVEAVLRQVNADVPYKAVTASRGKRLRAEPIAALYEQGRVHHVGSFSILEDQMVAFVHGISKSSPDRLDALVWAITELSGRGKSFTNIDIGDAGRRSSPWKV